MRYDDDEIVYVFEANDMRKLNRIRFRLAGAKPISEMSRRVLAKRLEAIMSSVLGTHRSTVEGM